MNIEEKVLKKVSEAISGYLLKGERGDVIMEYTVKKDEITAPKVTIVESAPSYFAENGYVESGIKSYSKAARVNVRHAYVVFETDRIAGTLANIEQDVKNINEDVARRAGK